MSHEKVLCPAFFIIAKCSAFPGYCYAESLRGLYFGGKGGYEIVRTKEEGSGYNGLEETKNESSPFWGGYVGFGQRSNSFYIGVEGEYIKGDTSTSTNTSTYKFGNYYAASLRLGVLAGKNDMYYLKGGYVRRDIKNSSNTVDGEQVAIGLEHALNPNILSRLELGVIKYEKLSVANSQNIDTYSGNISLGIGYNF